jgi:hypothetical protein
MVLVQQPLLRNLSRVMGVMVVLLLPEVLLQGVRRLPFHWLSEEEGLRVALQVPFLLTAIAVVLRPLEQTQLHC